MCFATLRWAFGVKGLDPIAQLVLLRLAWFTNHKTGLCNPSIHTLVEATGYSRATVFAKIAELKQAGLITISSPNGRDQITNHYHFPQVGGVQDVDPPVQDLDGEGPAHRPKPNTKPTPLPAGWAPPSNEVAAMKLRYTEFDVDVATENFIHHHRERDLARRDWVGAWKHWLSKEHPRSARTRRTAAGPARSHSVVELNDQRAAAFLAGLTEIPVEPARKRERR